MILEISRCVIDIVQRAVAEAAPLEACGLLFGADGRIDDVQACRNVADRPETNFEIDPVALIAAYRAERGGGRRIVGCYHSHPSGDAAPSARDAKAAVANDWIWLIAGAEGLAAYRAGAGGVYHSRFEPMALHVLSGA